MKQFGGTADQIASAFNQQRQNIVRQQGVLPLTRGLRNETQSKPTTGGDYFLMKETRDRMVRSRSFTGVCSSHSLREHYPGNRPACAPTGRQTGVCPSPIRFPLLEIFCRMSKRSTGMVTLAFCACFCAGRVLA